MKKGKLLIAGWLVQARWHRLDSRGVSEAHSWLDNDIDADIDSGMQPGNWRLQGTAQLLDNDQY